MLERTYVELGLNQGRLLRPARRPTADNRDDWSTVGDWLSLASHMEADRVFFVDDDPVLVFSVMPERPTESQFVKLYKQAWSLARPRCLFLATNDELRVYLLSAPPPRKAEQWAEIEPFRIIQQTANVAEALQEFTRGRLESGDTFDYEPSDGNVARRADRQLISDIGRAAELLRNAGLPANIAHGLIERVILVRYLEDRRVVTSDYLEQIAQRDPLWLSAFNTEEVYLDGPVSKFISCLSNKSLTNAIFAALEHEFNGDMFTVSDEELRLVTSKHLQLLQNLLTAGTRESLFLWAYDFSVVPTNIISSMYEHFYHLSDSDDQSSTHYTPAELVEFVVSNVLTPEVLHSNPKICDPACGSGVFLVEAYRRIVRHEMGRLGKRLSSRQLKDLLLTRIAGIDINPEAIRLAAFSLYLAFLSYQSAQDIRKAGPLPNLIIDERRQNNSGILVVNDAFASNRTESRGHLVPASDRPNAVLPWPDHDFDVIVGNPPWDEPRGTTARTLAEKWANDRGLPFGDRSPSQLFLWRTMSLMKHNGTAGMLVAASVFHNSRTTTRNFRRDWLGEVSLREVYNFSLARHLFFASAIAPFYYVRFEHRSNTHKRIVFCTVRPSSALRTTRSLAYAQVDRRIVDQFSLQSRDYLWKVYSWGTHRDDALMNRLDQESTLRELVGNKSAMGYGYQRGRGQPSSTLMTLPSLKSFLPWGPIDEQWIEPAPEGVKRQPDERLYNGYRLLVRRGITPGFGPLVRLESQPAAFRHHTYAISFESISPWQAKLAFGVLLSSLGRYRVFMTSGSWGLWHDSVLSSDVLQIPIPDVGSNDPRLREFLNIVDSIRQWQPVVSTFEELMITGYDSNSESISKIPFELLRKLDRSVYELFSLTPSETDLVEDWLKFQLPHTGGEIWRGRNQGAVRSRNVGANAVGDLSRYLEIFTRQWNAELSPDARLITESVIGTDSPVVIAIFRAYNRTSDLAEQAELGSSSENDWMELIARLNVGLRNNVSRRLATDGVVRIVTDTMLILVKRNEGRLWSASSAREDFEAMLVQAMNLQES